MRQVLPTEQRLDKDWAKPCEASRKAPQNTLSLKFWVGQALKQALKQESKIVWICEQCEHHANPVSCACPSRSSSHWRVPLPSASSTSKRPSQSGTCPQSTETNRSETYGEELGWTWMNFAYRVWLLCDLLWLLYIVLQSDHHWHSSPQIRHSESAVRIVLVSFCMP